jgi:hypothetical protein
MSSWFTDALKAAVPALRRNLDRSVAEAEADRLDRALARNRGNTITPTGPIRVTATPATQPAMPPRLREDRGMTEQLMTANDPEPPLGSIVEDATGVEWLRTRAVHDGVYWLRRDNLDGDPESWAKVAGNYGPVKLKGPTPTREQLIEACKEELWFLWRDLDEAFDRAINCTWSINALHVKERIHALTRLVGPIDWEDVVINLIENGVYQQVHAEVGIEVKPDMERVAQVRARANANAERYQR